MSHRIDIAEYGCYLLPFQGVRGGDKGERGNNHFAPQSQGANRNFKSDRGVAHGNAMADTKELGYPAFEFLDISPVIGEPTPIKDIFDAFEKALSIANVGTADDQGCGVVGIGTQLARLGNGMT